MIAQLQHRNPPIQSRIIDAIRQINDNVNTIQARLQVIITGHGNQIRQDAIQHGQDIQNLQQQHGNIVQLVQQDLDLMTRDRNGCQQQIPILQQHVADLIQQHTAMEAANDQTIADFLQRLDAQETDIRGALTTLDTNVIGILNAPPLGPGANQVPAFHFGGKRTKRKKMKKSRR